MTNYLVTGGAGFIGSHLVDKLLINSTITATPCTVTVYDNFSLGRQEHLEHHEGDDRLNIITGDLLDTKTLDTALENIDTVFHLAANSDISTSAKNPRIDFEQGAVATLNLLEAMRAHTARTIVFASSSAIYGELPQLPIHENSGPLFPISYYGAAKLYGESLLSCYAHHYGFKATIARFGNVIGRRATHGILHDLWKKLQQQQETLEVLGDGTQAKPYVEVEDLVKGILHAHEHGEQPLGYYHVACEGASIATFIAQTLLQELGLTATRIVYTGGNRGWKGDVPQVRFDTNKLSSKGWTASYTSDEAVRVSIQKFLKDKKPLLRKQ